MRTNIVIDPALLDAAMRAGPFKTKKDAVEAGLKLLARQVAYRDILALRGKLRWEDAPTAGVPPVREPAASFAVKPRAGASVGRVADAGTKTSTAAAATTAKRAAKRRPPGKGAA